MVAGPVRGDVPSDPVCPARQREDRRCVLLWSDDGGRLVGQQGPTRASGDHLGRHTFDGTDESAHRTRGHGQRLQDHRPPAQSNVFLGKDHVGARQRARGVRPDSSRGIGQGLHGAPSDRGPRHRSIRRQRHQRLRSAVRHLVRGAPGGCLHRQDAAAGDRSVDDRRGYGDPSGRRSHRAASGNTGRAGRRRRAHGRLGRGNCRLQLRRLCLPRFVRLGLACR